MSGGVPDFLDWPAILGWRPCLSRLASDPRQLLRAISGEKSVFPVEPQNGGCGRFLGPATPPARASPSCRLWYPRRPRRPRGTPQPAGAVPLHPAVEPPHELADRDPGPALLAAEELRSSASRRTLHRGVVRAPALPGHRAGEAVLPATSTSTLATLQQLRSVHDGASPGAARRTPGRGTCSARLWAGPDGPRDRPGVEYIDDRGWW